MMKCLSAFALLSLVFANPASAALTDNLVAYWDFEGNTNNSAAATGGSAYNGTISGNATTASTLARVGTGALQLDGNGDFMTVAALLDLNQSWSISAWFNSSIVPTTARHFVYESYNSASTGTGYGLSFGLREGTSGNTNFQTFTDTNTSDLSNSLQIADAAAANTWYNIVESYDASTKVLTIYLNGAERGTLSLGAQNFISANALRIGTYRSANDRWFNGSIDEFAIWNRALSAGEATGLHQLGTNGETLTTVKYTVSLTADPSAGGSVTGGGLYNASASVPISATPTPGYVFTAWDGDFTGQPASFTYTATADATASATFAEDTADPDNDGLTNFQEGAIYQTNPNNADTDGDEIPDGVEITIGTAPKISDAALVALVRSHLSTGSAGAIAMNSPRIVRDPATGAITLSLNLKGSANQTTWQDVTPTSLVPAGDGWNLTIPAPSDAVNSYILKGN